MKKVCQVCPCHFRNIGDIRKYLNQDVTEILVQAKVISKLGSRNALLYGLPTYELKKLQSVQNAPARIITLTIKVRANQSCSACAPLATCEVSHYFQDFTVGV